MIGGIANPYWEQMRALLAPHTNITAAIVYGSRAKGNFHDGSDIDLVLQGQNITSTQLTQIWSAYDDLYLPWKLDLTVYDAITNPALKDHIDRVGIVVYGAGT